MAGIYLHIPFCRQKCHYCNFFSVASKRNQSDLVDAIIREMELRRDYLNQQQINTIYFGGGTPSLLTEDELKKIQEALEKFFVLAPDPEITFEANPDDLNPALLKMLKSTFVNRLSMGVQSFYDEDLSYLNRVHNGEQALRAIRQARDAGFDKLTIDLIYGIPGMTDERWLKNLHTFFQTGIHHLSAYALTVEPRTALAHLIRKGRMEAVDEVQSSRHFEILLSETEKQGFVHYEISNFARPGHYSRHNSLYWLGGHYLGLGPSAHSYNGVSRQWNVSNLTGYIRDAATAACVEETETLTIEQRYNEYVMTSLRTSWGCDATHISHVFGEAFSDYLFQSAGKHLDAQLMRREGTRLFLTNRGKLFADGIAASMFLDEAL